MTELIFLLDRFEIGLFISTGRTAPSSCLCYPPYFGMRKETVSQTSIFFFAVFPFTCFPVDYACLFDSVIGALPKVSHLPCELLL